VGEETEKASEAKSDLTNGMTSKALVEDINVLTGWYGLSTVAGRSYLCYFEDGNVVARQHTNAEAR